MKWSLCFNFKCTSGGIATRQEIKCMFSCQVQLPSPSLPSAGCSSNLSPSPPPFLLQFLSFSFYFPFSRANFEVEDWGKTKWCLSLPARGSRCPLLSSGLAAGKQRDPSNGGGKRSGRVGGLTLVSQGALLWCWGLGKYNENMVRASSPVLYMLVQLA